MAAVMQAWSSAWNGDAGVRVSCPVRPVQTVTADPARVPGRTGIRPVRTVPSGACHRAGTVTS